MQLYKFYSFQVTIIYLIFLVFCDSIQLKLYRVRKIIIFQIWT